MTTVITCVPRSRRSQHMTSLPYRRTLLVFVQSCVLALGPIGCKSSETGRNPNDDRTMFRVVDPQNPKAMKFAPKQALAPSELERAVPSKPPSTGKPDKAERNCEMICCSNCECGGGDCQCETCKCCR